MQTHSFLVILAGVAEITDDLANALFEAVDAAVELNLRNGVAYLEVSRDARTLRQAIVRTIREVETVEDVRVVRIESEAANTIAKINADLLNVSPEG